MRSKKTRPTAISSSIGAAEKVMRDVYDLSATSFDYRMSLPARTSSQQGDNMTARGRHASVESRALQTPREYENNQM